MADKDNPGQFGNRDDTEEQAQKGGEQSPGQFGASEGANPEEAGKKAANKAQVSSVHLKVPIRKKPVKKVAEAHRA